MFRGVWRTRYTDKRWDEITSSPIIKRFLIMEVFNNRDIATVLNNYFPYVEDILNLSAVCSITYSHSWSQRMSEPYNMAARIRVRFGVIVPAEDAFTTFRKHYLQKDMWCLGGCGLEKEIFVSSKLAYQQRCCEFCFHVRVNDHRIRAVCWHEETGLPKDIWCRLQRYAQDLLFCKLLRIKGWFSVTDLDNFIAFAGIEHYFCQHTFEKVARLLAVPILGDGSEKWVLEVDLYLFFNKLIDQIPVEDITKKKLFTI